jgi:glycerophosphoryl diester phosphodiesterase
MAESFRTALEAGYDYVELDVRRTADGVLVVHHDPLTAGGHAISDMTWPAYQAELGEQALALDDLIAIAARGRGRLHVDIKEPGYEVEIVSRLLEQLPSDRFVVTSGDSSVLAVKTAFPEVTAGLSLGDDVLHLGPWRKLTTRLSELFPAGRVHRCQADFVAVEHRLARARVLRYARRAGLPAWVWTVDGDAEIARHLRDPRVAVLITNQPDVARRLSQAGIPPGSRSAAPK